MRKKLQLESTTLQRFWGRFLIALLWIAMSGAPLMAQTGANVRYIYDSAGQLIGAVDDNNNVTAYTYDGVGNLAAFERFSARGAVDIFFLDPYRGRPARLPQSGTPVTIHGIGFSAVPAQNQITFNGVPAVVEAATPNTLKTNVPAAATTGPVQVTSPLGTGTSRNDFIVAFPAVTVSPSDVVVPTRGQQPFIAGVREIDAGAGASLIWSVNGIVGGNATVGTIDRNGLYMAPASLPRPPAVTVAATHVDEPAAVGRATVNLVLTVGPVVTAVSYRIGRPQEQPVGPFFSAASYRIGRPQEQIAAPVFDGGASYTNIIIGGLSPNRLSRGAAGVPFTLLGKNFNGATVLEFLLPGGTRDTNITVSGLTVRPDGAQITGTISVSAAAATGARTVVVRTPEGPSVSRATSDNQLIIN